MSIKNLKYVLKQAFQGIWRNRVMSLASISSVTAVLVILGSVLLIVLNVSSISLMTKEKFDEVFVYLEDNLTITRTNELSNEILSFDGVLSVVYQTKEVALQQMKEDWGENADIFDGLENNPLPNSFIVQLETVDKSVEIIEEIEKFEGVEQVKYFHDVVEKLGTTASFMQTSGIFLIIALLLISVFIISNTVKITVASRKTEIELMQYVGASNGFVRGPFIIEGLVLGLIGTFLAILIVVNGYEYAATFITDKFSTLFSVYIVPVEIILKDIIIIFVTIGVGIGILGSLVSLKKFLSI